MIWHTSRYAYYGYPGLQLRVRRPRGVRRSRPRSAPPRNSRASSSSATTGPRISSSPTRRFYNTVGLNPPYFRDGFIRVENSFFKTLDGIIHRKSGAPGSCPICNLPDPDTVLVNNQFVRRRRPAAADHQPGRTRTTDPANNDRLFACRHNGQARRRRRGLLPCAGNAPCTTTRPDVAAATSASRRGWRAACSAAPQPSLTLGDAIVTEGDGGAHQRGLRGEALRVECPARDRGVRHRQRDRHRGKRLPGRLGDADLPAPGSVAQTLSVNILGDTAVEADETFRLDLSNAAGATLADGQGDAVILDDDAPSMSTLELTHGSRLSADLAGGTPTCASARRPTRRTKRRWTPSRATWVRACGWSGSPPTTRRCCRRRLPRVPARRSRCAGRTRWGRRWCSSTCGSRVLRAGPPAAGRRLPPARLRDDRRHPAIQQLGHAGDRAAPAEHDGPAGERPGAILEPGRSFAADPSRDAAPGARTR